VSRARILVVDDSDKVRERIGLWLREAGHEVVAEAAAGIATKQSSGR